MCRVKHGLAGRWSLKEDIEHAQSDQVTGWT
jgi:hypothetical protein